MDRKVRSALDKAIRASKQRQYTYGFIGKSSTSTPNECIVTSRPDFIYVRVTSPGTQSISIARNIGNVPIRTDTPIRMIMDGGVLTVESVDYSNGRWNAATNSDTLNIYGVIKHNHKIGSGLEYEIESLRLEPGRVFCSTHDMIAAINGFRHTLSTYLGGSIDLTSYAPTSGHHRWVLVGIDPTDNSELAVGSIEVINATPLTISDIDDIIFTGIPLGAFQLTYGDTELSQYAYEARRWLDTQVTLFDDSEGQPNDVVLSTALDGTSEFASRRDHQHSLGVDGRMVAEFYDRPLVDDTNGLTFDTNGIGLPSGWTSVFTEVDVDPYVSQGFFKFSINGTIEEEYRYQVSFELEDNPANVTFGPIYFSDWQFPQETTFYFGIKSGNDTSKYARVAIQWYNGDTWRCRFESHDAEETSWIELHDNPLVQPIYLTITATTAVDFLAKIGYSPLYFSQMNLGNLDKTGESAWGEYYLTVGFLTTENVTSTEMWLGGIDFI